MTLFSEVIETFLLREINARIAASENTDQQYGTRRTYSNYDKQLAAKKREQLVILKNNIENQGKTRSILRTSPSEASQNTQIIAKPGTKKEAKDTDDSETIGTSHITDCPAAKIVQDAEPTTRNGKKNKKSKHATPSQELQAPQQIAEDKKSDVDTDNSEEMLRSDTIAPLPEISEDSVYLASILSHIKTTERAINSARKAANKDLGETEPMLNMLKFFSENLLNQLEQLQLVNESRVDEPLCRLYHAIILYAATRELEKARKIAHPPGLIGRVASASTYVPVEAFLNALDTKVTASVAHIKSNLQGQSASDKNYQTRRDDLARRERASLARDELQLRTGDYRIYQYALPDYLSPSFTAASSTPEDGIDVGISYSCT